MPWIKKTFHLTRERRTYILGEFKGKYYGELDKGKVNFSDEQYYDFSLYEGKIIIDTVEKLRKEEAGPFPGFKEEDRFPGKLPDPLPCEICFASTKEAYKLEIHDLKFEKGSIQIVDHQQEHEEVFGTLKAIATGYIRDDVEYMEDRDVWEGLPIPNLPTPIHTDDTSNSLGKSKSYESAGRYQPSGYNFIHKPSIQEGCSSVLLLLLGIALFAFFLIALGPGALVLLAAGLVIYLFSFLGPKTTEWIGRTFGFLLFVFYVFAIVYGVASNFQNRRPHASSSSRSYRLARDEKRETSGQNMVQDRRTVADQSSTDDIQQQKEPSAFDTLISHHRIWRDYKGRLYEGDIKVLLSDYKRSFLQRYYFNPSASRLTSQYDQLLYNLSTYDRPSLRYIYQLFDSIGNSNRLNRTEFAEMIVSCIQDIPYTLVLNDGCNPNLYNDNFIHSYISEGNYCEGNVKFGLYTPVEFMANLKGDCDTRTLLLFTILSYYNYEVAILSSEFYKHSILAIGLPYSGVYKDIMGKHFYTWETTFMNFTPGQLPAEVANISLWRASLINQKTKHSYE